MQTIFAAHTSETNTMGESLNIEGFIQPSEKTKIPSVYIEDELDRLALEQELDDKDTMDPVVFSDIDIEELSEEDITQY